MAALNARSEGTLTGVHVDLVRVVRRAAELVQERNPLLGFVVTEGVRTAARQRELVNAGASRTMASRHLTGHAVDIAVTVGGQVRWDWPVYATVARDFKAAAAELGVPITWGGDWPRFRDGPHYELAREAYP